MLPILLKDGYKVDHISQYPENTEFIYSNFTARHSRTDVNYIIFFGMQYFIKEYLLKQFNENFFAVDKNKMLTEYKRRIKNYLGKDISVNHIAALHDLGYLPLRIKALAEGTKVPCGVPVLTIRNTKPEFFWLTNMLETLLSNILWKPCTSATTAFQYRIAFEKYATATGANKDLIQFQGHDFSFRGMSGIEDAMMSGAAHLLSFVGTDTIPAIDFLEQYYDADSDKELIGCSVPASEHSVICMGLPENEVATFKRLITKVYPTGIVSIVSDTWDFWKVIDSILPELKNIIISRDGKLVIRPDSGDPVKIICGDSDSYITTVNKGAIECLWDIFGGAFNKAGYKELDSHIGLIYGDSITLERQKQILEGLKKKGFASSNVILGIGSYTYEYVTRDTYGFAMKATWGQTKTNGPMSLFKDPKTDSGIKKSHKGLLAVERNDVGELICINENPMDDEHGGYLETVFHNGKLVRQQSLSEIRTIVTNELQKELHK